MGANAFAHESGIHQDGMLKNKDTYEIISPEEIGLVRADEAGLVMGESPNALPFLLSFCPPLDALGCDSYTRMPASVVCLMPRSENLVCAGKHSRRSALRTKLQAQDLARNQKN